MTGASRYVCVCVYIGRDSVTGKSKHLDQRESSAPEIIAFVGVSAGHLTTALEWSKAWLCCPWDDSEVSDLSAVFGLPWAGQLRSRHRNQHD